MATRPSGADGHRRADPEDVGPDRRGGRPRVDAQQIAERLAHGPRVAQVGRARGRVVDEAALGQPGGERLGRREPVGVALAGVHEGPDVLEVAGR
jgi:hypothetical protein